MCATNHLFFPQPGYLIDIKCESIAAKTLFSRMLSHHNEVGLTAEQVLRLLDINAEYQRALLALRMKFAQVTEQLEHKRGRLDEQALAGRRHLLDLHAELFRAEEQLFFEYGERGHRLLSDEQIDLIDRIYHGEKDACLAQLMPHLNAAIGPSYAVHVRELAER